VIEEMQAWSNRRLERIYAAVFIDSIMVKVRDGQIGNRPVYAAIGSTWTGTRTDLRRPHASGRGPLQ
jgi:putative transposase